MRAFAQAQSDEKTLHPCAEIFSGNDASDLSMYFQKNQKLQECMVGKKFPSFKATAMSGKNYSSTDLTNKVVLINSWFIGCAPCKAEIPLLNELNQEFKDKGFLLLAFSTDKDEHLTEFLKDRSITFDVFSNSKELLDQKLKTTYSYPANIFLNKKGEIVAYSAGGALDEKGLQQTKEKFRKIIMDELAK
jgi:thiol-disulfide isomerase/thioredoxin